MDTSTLFPSSLEWVRGLGFILAVLLNRRLETFKIESKEGDISVLVLEISIRSFGKQATVGQILQLFLRVSILMKTRPHLENQKVVMV